MNEAETRAEIIDPALTAAGWGVVPNSRILREHNITLGRLQGAGKRANADIADYVLVYRGHKLAIIEAKRTSLPETEGLAQAKRYSTKLQLRIAISTNGLQIYQADLSTGAEGHIDAYPTPEALWAITFADANTWRDRFADIPYEDKGGQWQPRYYQDIAIDRVLESIAHTKRRILLTLATGTGKTAIAFQIAWKLFHSRWNLSAEPTRRPRILFLADRNILASQAYNAFSAFAEDARVRIDPEEIRKKGRAPKNASIFFTIFQTFMTGKDQDGHPTPYFGEYPTDFFDLIIIDECHRGGARDESSWRGILNYFSPAVQLGLTATPKRAINTDTYAYFGDPVYIYSLKDGINDGFLTPFKLRQIATTIDEYTYTSDDTVEEGEVEAGRRYVEKDFNRTIEIPERERYRVKLLLENINQREKTLVFCANQAHALLVRDTINQMKSNPHPDYCVRVTANDGAAGDQFLSTFQDNEKTIPTILTTSQKLSTGVDALNVRNIVLLRPVASMIEFKQIIGRGTRLFDGKDYFTVYDFVKAYEHFSDPEWDGEPLEPEALPAPRPPVDEVPAPEQPDDERPDQNPRRRVKITLADGKTRTIQHMIATTFWDPSGRPMSAAEFITKLFGALPDLFRDEDELRALWGVPQTRATLLANLADRGFSLEALHAIERAIDAENSDIFDVLAYIAFARAPLTRQTRVATTRASILSAYPEKLQTFLDFVLDQYIKQGVQELDNDNLVPLLNLKYQNTTDATNTLGDPTQIRQTFINFQQHLYQTP